MDALAIVRQARGPALATDTEDRIVSCNREALELLGLGARAKVEGRSFYDLAQPADLFGNRLSPGHIAFLELLRQGDAARPFQLYIHTADGSRQRISVSVVVVLQGRSEQSRFVYLLRPIFRRRRADEAIDRLLRLPSVGGSIVNRAARDESNSDYQLSRRQTQVVRLLAQGRSNEEIAHELGISIHTVRSHVQGLLHRLKVHGKAEAVAVAYREGLL